LANFLASSHTGPTAMKADPVSRHYIPASLASGHTLWILLPESLQSIRE
jgi:hypothetical protein